MDDRIGISYRPSEDPPSVLCSAFVVRNIMFVSYHQFISPNHWVLGGKYCLVRQISQYCCDTTMKINDKLLEKIKRFYLEEDGEEISTEEAREAI